MKYAVIKKPRNIEVCVCGTERGAVNLINALEAQDVRENVFEPDTYYIEMRLEKNDDEKSDGKKADATI